MWRMILSIRNLSEKGSKYPLIHVYTLFIIPSNHSIKSIWICLLLKAFIRLKISLTLNESKIIMVVSIFVAIDVMGSLLNSYKEQKHATYVRTCRCTYNGRPFKNTGGERVLNRRWPERTVPYVLPFHFNFSIPIFWYGRVCARAYVAGVVSFTCFATRGPARANKYCKLRIFLIKFSHSSSTYENTFAFQHFSDRQRAITSRLKER